MYPHLVGSTLFSCVRCHNIFCFTIFCLIYFLFDFNFLSVVLWCFSVLVADVEVMEDGVFIRLRKERSSVRTRTRIRKFLLLFLSLW